MAIPRTSGFPSSCSRASRRARVTTDWSGSSALWAAAAVRGGSGGGEGAWGTAGPVLQRELRRGGKEEEEEEPVVADVAEVSVERRANEPLW